MDIDEFVAEHLEFFKLIRYMTEDEITSLFKEYYPDEKVNLEKIEKFKKGKIYYFHS